ncbi:hypothetical protein BWI97_08345 [Siphonobacter sp. BAB-5405]|nr:hypothetical protein BWI97_08345 [Siphonobacter sp. BAB-5405]
MIDFLFLSVGTTQISVHTREQSARKSPEGYGLLFQSLVVKATVGFRIKNIFSWWESGCIVIILTKTPARLTIEGRG